MTDPHSNPAPFTWPNGEPFISPAADRRRAEKAESDAGLAAAENVAKELESLLAAGVGLTTVSTESGVKVDELRKLLKRTRASDHQGPLGSWAWSLKQQAEAVSTLAGWLVAYAEGDKTRRAHASTPTTAAICELIEEARELRRLTVIIGGVGVGKSFAGRLMAASHPRTARAPGVLHLEHRESHRTINQFLLHLWQRLADSPDQEPRGDLQGAVLAQLRKGDVVVIDECNRLSQCGAGRVTEVIRDLADNAPASWVLLGNSEATKAGKILDGKLYGAFLSRARLYNFDSTTEEDVSAFMEWKDLQGDKLRRLLVQAFAGARNAAPRRDGCTLRNVGLRGLDMALDDARRAAKGKGLSDSEALLRHLTAHVALAQP